MRDNSLTAGSLDVNGGMTADTGSITVSGNTEVDAGANLSLGSGSFQSGDFAGSGTFTGGSGSHNFTGNWLNNGSYAATTGTTAFKGSNVEFRQSGTFSHSGGAVRVSGTGNSDFLGSFDFHDFSCDTPGKTLRFSPGCAYGFEGRLFLNGENGNPLSISSTGTGAFNFNNTGNWEVSYAAVSYCHALNPIASFTSINQGYNLNWQFAPNTTLAAPATLTPVDQEKFSLSCPVLTVINSTNTTAELYYEFWVSSSPDFTSGTLSSGLISETQATTSWQVNVDLLPGQYYWKVRAYDGMVYSNWCTSAAFEIIRKVPEFTVEVSLRSGWNLISLGLQPESRTIEVIFHDITDKMKYVMAFFRSPVDEEPVGFRTYINLDDLKDFSTLRVMDGFHGYWVYMNNNATLEVKGSAISDTTELNLASGWNLAGYWLSCCNPLPLEATQAGTVIDCVFNKTPIKGKARYIMGFYRDSNGGSEGFRSFMNNAAIGFSNLSKLDSYHGYWFYMDGEGTLNYSYRAP
ncbi:MAG: hypothetical protein PHW04_18180 [Candidatus Wallbacteria bacterium]|nr:hypothetical protein [Candidatus Wallbacteria bacterium]